MENCIKRRRWKVQEFVNGMKRDRLMGKETDPECPLWRSEAWGDLAAPARVTLTNVSAEDRDDVQQSTGTRHLNVCRCGRDKVGYS